MATYTENYALVKPTYGELADVAVINRNMDTIDGIMHSNRTMLAPAFSQTEDYAVGDVVVYEGNLYRFIVPHTAGNWDGTEVEQTTLGEEVSTKGGADVTKTASGNPIEISDAANAPLVKCVTTIQGNQDLHGYDKPWVGGAGKNKIPLTVDEVKARNTSGTWSGNTYTISGLVFSVETDGDGNVTGIKGVSGTASGSDVEFTITNNMGLPSGSYIINGAISNGKRMYFYNGTTWYDTTGTDKSFTITGSETLQRVRIVIANGQTLNNDMFYPMVRLATETDPTFTPYSNICPITAYTEGEIEVRGRNVFNPSTAVAGYVSAGGDIVAQSSTNLEYTSDYIMLGNAEEVTVGYNTYGSSETKWLAIGWFKSNGEFIRRTDTQTNYNVFTVPTDAVKIRVSMRTYGHGIDNCFCALNTATAYEPYTSTTHTATFSQSIYQGNADFVNGKVVREWAIIDLGDRTWTKSGVRFYTSWSSFDAEKPYASTTDPGDYLTNAICTQYHANTRNAIERDNYAFSIHNSSKVYLTVVDSRYSTVEDFKMAMSGVMVAYPLATPTTSSITPSNLPIKSLFGYNHIENSTGDMEIEYITENYQPLVDLIEESGGGGSHTYSTTEQVVGKWIDGSEVYEKTIYYATLSCDRSDWAQLEALDAETFISYSATAHMETASGRQIDNNYIRISYYNGYLYHHEPEFGTGMVDLYVTVRYTKPTTPTRSLNLTKSAMDEIPDEIKNAPFEEKPETNEADDDAPTEVDER